VALALAPVVLEHFLDALATHAEAVELHRLFDCDVRGTEGHVNLADHGEGCNGECEESDKTVLRDDRMR
jgi:hypothetical protein